eukprot:m.19489 g.19489  ORF g.19489 m.19489 type:complete len:55 (-) comp10912_c0_seq3:106-270(-)
MHGYDCTYARKANGQIWLACMGNLSVAELVAHQDEPAKEALGLHWQCQKGANNP